MKNQNCHFDRCSLIVPFKNRSLPDSNLASLNLTLTFEETRTFLAVVLFIMLSISWTSTMMQQIKWKLLSSALLWFCAQFNKQINCHFIIHFQSRCNHHAYITFAYKLIWP